MADRYVSRQTRSERVSASAKAETLVIDTFQPRHVEAMGMLDGPERHKQIEGGSRSGKTFLLTSATVKRGLLAPRSRHIILRHRRNAIKTSIWQDTLPKVMSIVFPWLKRGKDWDTNESDLSVQLPAASEIILAGLDEKDRVEKILGTEYATMYFNECSQIKYSSVVVARTRLAQKAMCLDGSELPLRAYYDLNPVGTAHWTYKLFYLKQDPDSGRPLDEPSQYARMALQPEDNRANLPKGYIEGELASLPARQRVRFLEGKYQAEVEGALWTLERIEQSRCDPSDVPEMKRIAIGVDPSGTSGEEGDRSNEVGIVAVGLGIDDRGYVFEDATTEEGPAGWGRKVVQAFQNHDADAVVGETNFGGDMVRFVVQKAAEDEDVEVPFRKVTASRGKHIRAEPISALYEQDRIRHVGRFPKLEDQMQNMSTDGYKGSKSPDRLDALVWALWELMVKKKQGSKAIGKPLTVGGMVSSTEGAPHRGGILTEGHQSNMISTDSIKPAGGIIIGGALGG